MGHPPVKDRIEQSRPDRPLIAEQVGVYDEDGRWIANSNGADMPDANNGDRGYFIFHRDHADRGPHVSPSIKSRSTGEWIMTVSRRINRRLELLALEDALTGLSNHRQFDLFIHSEMGGARRSLSGLALLMIDVDHFKLFNDHYGHVAGDECLRKISAIITENLKRPADRAARYGGEEFAVVLPEADYVGAFLVAEKIRRAVLDACIERSASIDGRVTVNLGVAAYDPASQIQPDD